MSLPENNTLSTPDSCSDHHFQRHLFGAGENTKCSVCKQHLGGLDKFGLVCLVCKGMCHEFCSHFIYRCPGKVLADVSGLKPNAETVDVNVTIVSAEGLVKTSLLQAPDPFCILNLDGEETRTLVCRRTIHPVWNETHVLSVSHGSALAIYLYDKKTYREFHQGAAFLGMASIPMQMFNSINMCAGSTLTFKLKKLKETDVVTGSVTIAVRYAHGVQEESSQNCHYRNTEAKDLDVLLDWEETYEGWTKMRDENGRTYFTNDETEEVMFSPPTKLATSQLTKDSLQLQRQKSEDRYRNTYHFYAIEPESYSAESLPDVIIESDSQAFSSSSTEMKSDKELQLDDCHFMSPQHVARIRKSYDFIPKAVGSSSGKERSKSPSLLPAQPKSPRCLIHPKDATAVALKWKNPDEKQSSFSLFGKSEKKPKLKFNVLICEFTTECDDDVDKYVSIYQGEKLTFVAAGLVPGMVYSFRVICTNEYGSSLPSEPSRIQIPITAELASTSTVKKTKTTSQRKKDCPFFMAGYCPYGMNCRFEHGSGFQTEEDVLAFQIAASMNFSPQAAIVAATEASLRETEQFKIDLKRLPQYKRNFHNKQKLLREQLVVKPGECHVTVRRDNLFESSYEELSALSTEELCKHLFVHFLGEGGLDYGGLAREWFFLMSREIASSRLGLFGYSGDSTYTLQINPDTAANNNVLKYYHFVGRLVGLAVYHRHFMDLSFFIPFYKQLLSNDEMTLNDLQTVDPAMHRSLIWILENNVTDLDATFSVDVDHFGEVVTIDLKKGGRNLAVTEKNKREFVQMMVDWRCRRGTETQMELFKTGFNQFIPDHCLVEFDERELEFLICGLTTLDIDDWQSNAIYKDCTATDDIVVWFWEILRAMNMEEQARLLQFVTGTSRVPIEGFQALQGTDGPRKFCLQLTPESVERLPQSHTCFNRLDLPRYQEKEVLRKKLLIAIEGFQGFTGD